MDLLFYDRYSLFRYYHGALLRSDIPERVVQIVIRNYERQRMYKYLRNGLVIICEEFPKIRSEYDDSQYQCKIRLFIRSGNTDYTCQYLYEYASRRIVLQNFGKIPFADEHPCEYQHRRSYYDLQYARYTQMFAPFKHDIFSFPDNSNLLDYFYPEREEKFQHLRYIFYSVFPDPDGITPSSLPSTSSLVIASDTNTELRS